MSGATVEPIQAQIKAIGKEITLGNLYGKIASGFHKIATQTVGLNTIKIAADKPLSKIYITAPVVISLFDIIERKSDGKLALAAIEKASATKNAKFYFEKQYQGQRQQHH